VLVAGTSLVERLSKLVASYGRSKFINHYRQLVPLSSSTDAIDGQIMIMVRGQQQETAVSVGRLHLIGADKGK
jgi:hypothetical protein